MCFPTIVPSGTSRILPATLVNKVPSYLFIHAALKQQVLIGDKPPQMLSAYIYLLSRREENMFATVVYLRCDVIIESGSDEILFQDGSDVLIRRRLNQQTLVALFKNRYCCQTSTS